MVLVGASEWTGWPLFVAQPFIPPLLFFATPQTLLVTLVVVGWVWSLIQYRTVNADLASIGCTIVVFLKWPSALVCGGLFLARGQYGLAALSAFWPLVTLGLMGLVPPGLTGVVEIKFMAQLLGVPESVLFDGLDSNLWRKDQIGGRYRQQWSYTLASWLTPLLLLTLVCGAWYLWTRLRPAAPSPTPPVAVSPAAEAVKRGNAAREKGDLDLSIVEYTEAIRLDPKLAAAYSNRGASFAMTRDLDKAIVDCNEAIRLDVNDALAYGTRAGAYDDKGNHDKAIADYTEAIRVEPDGLVWHYLRCATYEAKGDLDGAIEGYTEVIRLNPEHAQAYHARGLAYAKKGDDDKAISDYTNAIHFKSNYAKAYFNRGLAYRREGDTEKARADFDQAKRLGYKPP